MVLIAGAFQTFNTIPLWDDNLPLFRDRLPIRFARDHPTSARQQKVGSQRSGRWPSETTEAALGGSSGTRMAKVDTLRAAETTPVPSPIQHVLENSGTGQNPRAPIAATLVRPILGLLSAQRHEDEAPAELADGGNLQLESRHHGRHRGQDPPADRAAAVRYLNGRSSADRWREFGGAWRRAQPRLRQFVPGSSAVPESPQSSPSPAKSGSIAFRS